MDKIFQIIMFFFVLGIRESRIEWVQTGRRTSYWKIPASENHRQRKLRKGNHFYLLHFSISNAGNPFQDRGNSTEIMRKALFQNKEIYY